jgi:hypothetical protein
MSDWFAELPEEMQATYADLAGKTPAEVVTAYGEAKNNVGKPFFDGLPDDLKTNEAFSSYKEMQPADLVKSHAELSGKMKDALLPPGEGASPEEVAAFDARLRQLNGVPESPDGYKLTLPEGVPADDPLLTAFTAEAHKAGMSPGQVQAGISAFLTWVTQSEQAAEAQLTQAKDALKIEQGVKYDEYLQASESAMRELGIEAGYKPEEVLAMITQTGLKNNMMFIKMFHKASRMFEEGRLKGQSGVPVPDIEKKFFPSGIK